jgi:hypothetical protein
VNDTVTATDIPWDGDPGPEPGTVLDRFVTAKARKTDLERELRLIKDELSPLEEQLLELFTQEGVSGKRHAQSGKLVSITRQIWARAANGDKDAAAAALENVPGLAAFVQKGFNVQSLSAHFRELARNHLEETGEPAPLDQLLPTPLHGLIELTEDHTLSVRS